MYKIFIPLYGFFIWKQLDDWMKAMTMIYNFQILFWLAFYFLIMK